MSNQTHVDLLTRKMEQACTTLERIGYHRSEAGRKVVEAQEKLLECREQQSIYICTKELLVKLNKREIGLAGREARIRAYIAKCREQAQRIHEDVDKQACHEAAVPADSQLVTIKDALELLPERAQGKDITELLSILKHHPIRMYLRPQGVSRNYSTIRYIGTLLWTNECFNVCTNELPQIMAFNDAFDFDVVARIETYDGMKKAAEDIDNVILLHKDDLLSAKEQWWKSGHSAAQGARIDDLILEMHKDNTRAADAACEQGWNRGRKFSLTRLPRPTNEEAADLAEQLGGVELARRVLPEQVASMNYKTKPEHLFGAEIRKRAKSWTTR